MQTDLSEKTFVVTGATSGIGLAVAEILVQQGAGLIGVGRSVERCGQAVNRLRAMNPAAEIDYIAADLCAQREVRRLAAQIEDIVHQRGKIGLDGLVNNAGTFTYWFTLTPDGVEMQWAVNHLAPFLLTHQLLGLLQAAPAARVVTVSSDSHYGSRINWEDPQLRRKHNGLRAYGNTKLANVLFTLELNRRLGLDSSVRAFAADPGLVKTDIGLKGTPGLVRWVWKMRRSGGISAEQSAQGIVYLLVDAEVQQSTDLYWKHGSARRASREALNPQSASRLWLLSEQMCGVAKEGSYV
jgi:NAD(P)-dependent dehydrogenase (short-subunit alcohol dehydrogenase family)